MYGLHLLTAEAEEPGNRALLPEDSEDEKHTLVVEKREKEAPLLTLCDDEHLEDALWE